MVTAKNIAEEANYGYLFEIEVEALHILTLMPESDDLDYVPVVVNLGAGFGTSSLAMREIRQIELTTIDCNEGFLENERKTFARAGIPLHKQILSDSHAAELDLFPENYIDMVFVDADHREPQVRLDIAKWIPLVKDGGIMAFHDYGHHNYPGVKMAVDEMMQDHEHLFLAHTLKAYKILRSKG